VVFDPSVIVFSDIEDMIGHTDTKIISDSHLPVLVPQMAVHADVSSYLTPECQLPL
jgi:D-ribose pyranose/furanose isomerase RbsD